MELASVVVIPARNEESEIAGCLRALARQTVGRTAFETIVVLDGCVDRTESVARQSALKLGLSVRLIPGPAAGAGAARREGMDAAAERLFELGCDDGLIACTDADSRPAPDWLARQLDHLRGGARVVAGQIELDRVQSSRLPAGVLRRRENQAAVRLEQVRELDPLAEHHHFAGASLGVTARVYREVGGLEPVEALEDATFAIRLGEHRIPIDRPSDVRVRTSARIEGRARRGLALDMAVSTWMDRRRYDVTNFPLQRLAELKRTTSVTVIVPAKECAASIAGVVQRTVGPLRRAGLVDDVVVVDAASHDDTARLATDAGARVIQQDELLADRGGALGKGDAMWRALAATEGDIVCFIDGDTANPDPRHLQGLLGPLFAEASVRLVKGSFERPLRIGDRELSGEGGRVTELIARPLINLHEPRLAGFSQPLAGEFAARRDVLEQIPFPVGYGVEIAALFDVLRLCGLDALAECHLGTRQNRHQPLRKLGEMAYAVLVAVENRLEGRPAAAGGHYLRPWDDGAISQVPVIERPPIRSLRGPLVSGSRSSRGRL